MAVALSEMWLKWGQLVALFIIPLFIKISVVKDITLAYILLYSLLISF